MHAGQYAAGCARTHTPMHTRRAALAGQVRLGVAADRAKRSCAGWRAGERVERPGSAKRSQAALYSPTTRTGVGCQA